LKARKRRRARKYLCAHLLPVLRVLLQMGHDVYATEIGPRARHRGANRAGLDRPTRRVEVALKTGPSIAEIRERCSLPGGVVHGSNRDGRSGPRGHFLGCRHCGHSLSWPLPGERRRRRLLEDAYSGDAWWREFAEVCRPEWRHCRFQKELLEAVGGDRDLAAVMYRQLDVGALKWLDQRIPALSGRKPRTCLRTAGGRKGVKECLMRMW
jgi:hypothetical protein